MRWKNFSLADLYAALDAQREARGMTWAQVRQAMNGDGPHRPGSHPIGTSTITATRTGRAAEGDGVLQMILWLKRTPESFVPGHPWAESPQAQLPEAPAGKVLRFDTRKLYEALADQRAERELTWAQVAREVGSSASMLTHLAKGGRTWFPFVMHVTAWLDRPLAEFTRISGSKASST